MRPELTIAIDFDDTFTADPDAWRDVIRILRHSGHRVICVSARRDDFANRRELTEALPSGVDVLLAYDTPKRNFAASRGYDVNIWIDDKPECIPTTEDLRRMCG